MGVGSQVMSFSVQQFSNMPSRVRDRLEAVVCGTQVDAIECPDGIVDVSVSVLTSKLTDESTMVANFADTAGISVDRIRVLSSFPVSSEGTEAEATEVTIRISFPDLPESSPLVIDGINAAAT